MRNFLPVSLKKNAGFTLVELMVVISIIGILAAIGLTVYTQTQRVARDGRRVGDILEAQKALEQYYAINKAYPAGSTPVNLIAGALGTFPTFFENGTPPSDPNAAAVGNYQYQFYKCGSAEKYIMCAKLENPSGKANRTTIPPADYCGSAADGSVDATYFCVGAISN